LFLKLRNNETISIVALGDSSVFGVGDVGGVIPATGAGWAGRVAHDLNSPRFLNLATNGSRARHLSKYQLPAALAFDPNLTLICIGTNDVLRGDFSPSEIEQP
jgi:lysophospholipase L1-like esterase